MRSRVSRKKRRIIIISSFIVTALAILVLVWKLTSFTKSLKMDFDKVGLNCSSVTVINNENFSDALSSGALPDVLVTDEARQVIASDGAELCVVWLDYSIFSDVELKEDTFKVDIKPTKTANGIVYSYSPLYDTKKDGDVYTFRQAMLIDKADVKSFFFEKELPRPFKGSFSFELSYCCKGQDKMKRVGFNTDNQL